MVRCNLRRVNIIFSLTFVLHLVAIKEGSKIGSTRRTSRNTSKNPFSATEGKIRIIRSEKSHGLVFIEAILESEGIV